ncbi:MAG: diaminopimelate epimerase [Synergistaceae bacterium]|nr:diaminopimelate epimerase [Synergistaceae bacterium]
MKFTKMQGCGNDYVYVNCFSETVENPTELAKRIANRHYGVGGDGLILIEPSEGADAAMRMFNQDGSEGEMCGNGIRCVAKYIYDHGIIPSSRRETVIHTRAGQKRIVLHVEDGKVSEATVDMGKPLLAGQLPEPITVRDMELSFIGVDVGNPHAVYFLEDNPALGAAHVAELNLEAMGRDFETHPRFPDRVNSEFIEVVSPTEVRFRVWERGSGETLACGTGATASVFAGVLAKKLDKEVLVHLLGGDLRIRYDAESGHCFMTGPAVEVFSGEFPA